MSEAPSKFEKRTQTQEKTFKNWVNLHLTKARESSKVENLNSDLTTGEVLVLLSEVFIPGPINKYYKEPKNQLQRTNNHSLALERFERDGTELINIHPSTLGQEQDNTKIFMGLIFQLILRYSLSEKNASDEADADAKKKQQTLGQLKQSLIEWVNSKLVSLTEAESAAVRAHNGSNSTEPITCSNLDSSWQDGTVLTGLAIALHPTDKRQHGLSKLSERSSEITGDHAPLQAAIERSDKNLTVPALMDAESMRDSPDQNSILTYVSQFKDAVYVDDEPVVESVELEWDEPTFLQIEVDCLDKRDLAALNEQKTIIESKLAQYKQNKESGKEYKPSCDRKAKRMELHLRRVTTTFKNLDDDKNAASAKSDEAAKDLADKDSQLADKDSQLAAKDSQLADKDSQLAAKDAELAEKEEENKKAKKALQEEQDKLASEQAKAKKLQEDLDASQAALAKLQKKQSRLAELQKALLECANISDEMLNDEIA